MFKIWIITLFPEYFKPFLEWGVAAQALKSQRGVLWEVHLVNPRDFTNNNPKAIDDYPYGGGPGMVMRPDFLERTIVEGIGKKGGYGEDYSALKQKLHVIYPSPRGPIWNNESCKEFTKKHFSFKTNKDLVFICGRYEGIDERFLDLFVDEHISLGDYVLTGGELATMAILDSALRFVPGVLGNKNSSVKESFQNNRIEHPQYTRPATFQGLKVPPVLLSGNHAEIEKWQEEASEDLTRIYRPDLLERSNEIPGELGEQL